MAIILRAWILALALAGAGGALAETPTRVGRIAHAQGEVDFRPAFGESSSPAMLNWPITTGNIVESGPHGHAEIRAAATAIRIAPDSVVEIGQLDERRFLVYLTRGSIHLRAATLPPEEFTVRTPTGRVRIPANGLLRIDMEPDGESALVSVHEGTVIVDSERSSLRVATGQKALLQRQGVHPAAIAAADHDDFDRWSSERDRTFRQASARHVSPEMTGYEELSRHGVWHQHAEFGTVWYPTGVNEDWAPYRYGHWAHIDPWGWTWIDQAPWGYAPTHYGRWAYIERRWGWVPGVVTVSPAWAPALVAWVGGRHFNATFSFGNAPAVGWIPLAPHERFVPGYRVSDDTLRRLNPHPTITVPPSVGSSGRLRGAGLAGDNRSAPNAVSLLPQDRFGMPVGSTAVRRVIPAAPEILTGPPVQGRSALAPLMSNPSFTTNSPPAMLSAPRFTPPASQAPPSTVRHGVIIGGPPGMHGIPGNPAAAHKLPQFSSRAIVQPPSAGVVTPRVIDAPAPLAPGPLSPQFGAGPPQRGAGSAMPQFNRPPAGALGGANGLSTPSPGGARQSR